MSPEPSQTMLHAIDSPGSGHAGHRAAWMALLARAPVALLEPPLVSFLVRHRTQWLRRPETGLYMVQGRTGGTGERFNLGEVTVTRCALRSLGPDDEVSPVGVAYVMGRHHRQAELAALADALLQQPTHHDALNRLVLQPVREHLNRHTAQRQAKAQSTKVDFFTVAREAGRGQAVEDPT